MDKEKSTQVIDADGLRMKNKSSIIQSFVIQTTLNSRVSKSVCHILLDFSAQDKGKLSNALMRKIARGYMEKWE